MKRTKVALLAISLLFAACNNNKTREPEKKTDSQSHTPVTKPSDSKKPPIINIMDTVSLKKTVLCLKDSSASMEGISAKLAAIYGKLQKIAADGKVRVTGMPMAWYKGDKAPYFFQAGLVVDKKPAKLPAGVFVKDIGQAPIVVAHFYGPYDMLGSAYEALRDWVSSHKRSIAGEPYEIYFGSPAVEKDPYKLRTDIVMPIK